jgi:enoyl-CoA hydratase/carnithine racemase
MAGSVRVERRGEIALLTLDNLAKKNALDPVMLLALCDQLAAQAALGARAAVLTAEGELFSSGFDLDALDGSATAAQPVEAAVRAIVHGPLPVIAALNGLCIGGGCELASACDLRVAHPGVALQMPPVRLGLVYPAFGLRRFVALIGASRTRELFLTAERISAATALGWGLVDRVVPAEEVLATAMDLARAIARGAPSAIRGTRALLASIEALPTDEVQATHERIVREAFTGEDAREALRAFAEKRAPRWKS